MSLSLRCVNVPARKKGDQREIKLGMENSYILYSYIRPLSRSSPSSLFLYRLSFSVIPVDSSRFLSILVTLSFLAPASRRIDKGFSLQEYFYLTIACMT